MSPPSELFHSSAEYHPDRPLDELLKAAPARWVVYLFTDAEDRPVQLLCVKNLRASLKRRLGEQEETGPTRRLDYRELVRRIYWRRVDSAFEADLVYLEMARAVFPQSYRGMVGFDPAWFVQVNPENNFPRYVKTTDPRRGGIVIGPFADKHAAARFMHLVEDAFDLCRYYNILVEAPRARACAYKEMGKCPAPCDGSISMAQYRELIAWSAQTVVAPETFIAQHTHRMNMAASDLNFEAALKIKQYVEQISQFGKGAFRYARRIEDFRYLSFQQGPRKGTAKIFLIREGLVEEIGGVIGDPAAVGDWLRRVLNSMPPRELDEAGVERIGVVTDHLFRAKRSSGVYLQLDEVERALLKAYRELLKQDAPAESAPDDEGVVKELQQM